MCVIDMRVQAAGADEGLCARRSPNVSLRATVVLPCPTLPC